MVGVAVCGCDKLHLQKHANCSGSSCFQSAKYIAIQIIGQSSGYTKFGAFTRSSKKMWWNSVVETWSKHSYKKKKTVRCPFCKFPSRHRNWTSKAQKNPFWAHSVDKQTCSRGRLWGKLLANLFWRDHPRKGRHEALCAGEPSYYEKMLKELDKVCWSEYVWNIMSWKSFFSEHFNCHYPLSWNQKCYFLIYWRFFNLAVLSCHVTETYDRNVQHVCGSTIHTPSLALSTSCFERRISTHVYSRQHKSIFPSKISPWQSHFTLDS